MEIQQTGVWPSCTLAKASMSLMLVIWGGMFLSREPVLLEDEGWEFIFISLTFTAFRDCRMQVKFNSHR